MVDIAEQFYSLQGEGPHAGTPAVFLRLAGCNLSCGWGDDLTDYEPGDDPTADGAAWVCDTIDVWREPSETPTVTRLVADWRDRGFLATFAQGAHLVCTGGEPLLPAHQTDLASLLRTLGGALPEPAMVEVETNGTQVPDVVGPYVDQFNVSLKLSNSGMAADRRLDEDVIAWFIDERDRSTFKFVVADAQDCTEVADLCTEYGIPEAMVMVMPAGASQAALADTYPLAAAEAKDRGWQFSPRLHVNIWDQATGV
jgi:6-pyruvoyltetrahydropterin 2'-reductase